MWTPAALIVSAFIIAGSILAHAEVTKNSGRYELMQGGLLDTYTGELLEYDRSRGVWERLLKPPYPRPPFQ